MRRLLIISCIALWLSISWTAASAQEQQPELTVSLRDVQGAPIVGAAVIVRDGSGTRDLLRATTDARGVATFNHLTESQVRIAIAGTLLNGTKLYQPGNDAQGIALLLDPPPTVLDLRSETDGMVVPDPATMTALEPGVPVTTGVAVVPTAPIATRIPVAQAALPTSAPAPGSAAAPIVATGDDTPVDSGGGHVWLGLGLLVILIGAGVGIVVVQRRAA